MGQGAGKLATLRGFLGGVSTPDINTYLQHLIKERFKQVTHENIHQFALGVDEIKLLMDLEEDDAKSLISFVETASKMAVLRKHIEISPQPEDGQINYQELAAALVMISAGSVTDKMTLLFEHFDTNKAENGEEDALDEKELFHLFDFAASMSFAASIPPVKSDGIIEEARKELEERRQNTLKLVKEVIEKADKDKNGKIEAQEFLNWARSSVEIQRLLHDMEIALTSYQPYAKWVRPANDKQFRILSLDGGGMRGMIMIKALQRIEQQHPGFIDSIDMFAGTSTGAIIASLLAVGNPLDKIEKIFDDFGGEVFGQDRGLTGSIMESKYDNKAFIECAEKCAGNYRLKDLHSKKIFMPTLGLTRRFYANGETEEKTEVGHWGPVYYHNFRRYSEKEMVERGLSNPNQSLEQREKRRKEEENRLKELIRDAVLKSAAAPVYFPAYDDHVDGGLVCNNPAAAAIFMASHKEYADTHPFEDMVLLSLGTGVVPMTKETGMRGLRDVEYIIEMLMSGGQQFIDGACYCLLGSRYYRFQPLLTKQTALDDYKGLDQLKLRAAELNMTKVNNWIADKWFLGQPPKTQLEEKMKLLRESEKPQQTYQRLSWVSDQHAERAVNLPNLESVMGKSIGLDVNQFSMAMNLSEASGSALIMEVIHIDGVKARPGEEAHLDLSVHSSFTKAMRDFVTLSRWMVSVAHSHRDNNIDCLIVFSFRDCENIDLTVFLAATKRYFYHLQAKGNHQEGLKGAVDELLKEKGLNKLPANFVVAADFSIGVQSTAKLYPAGQCQLVTAGLEEPSELYSNCATVITDRLGKVRLVADPFLFALKRYTLGKISALPHPVHDPKNAKKLENEYRTLLKNNLAAKIAEQKKLEANREREKKRLEKRESDNLKIQGKFLDKINKFRRRDQ